MLKQKLCLALKHYSKLPHKLESAGFTKLHKLLPSIFEPEVAGILSKYGETRGILGDYTVHCLHNTLSDLVLSLSRRSKTVKSFEMRGSQDPLFCSVNDLRHRENICPIELEIQDQLTNIDDIPATSDLSFKGPLKSRTGS